MVFEPLVRDIVARALAEDIGPGDLTTALTVDGEARGRAVIAAKQELVVAGMLPARLAFELTDANVRFFARAADGDRVEAGSLLAEVNGPAASILTAERTALNFIMRLSGTATLAARFAAAVRETGAVIVDTRKTTPGLRVLEKAAVKAGGAANHRFGLSDGILIKDNHIAAAGSITAAVQKARAGAPHTLKVEVEVPDIGGLREAIAAGADVVMLDNMTVDEMAAAVREAGGRVLLEASGGVNLETVAAIAEAGVNVISVGALTHSAPAVDVSLDFR